MIILQSVAAHAFFRVLNADDKLELGGGITPRIEKVLARHEYTYGFVSSDHLWRLYYVGDNKVLSGFLEDLLEPSQRDDIKLILELCPDKPSDQFLPEDKVIRFRWIAFGRVIDQVDQMEEKPKGAPIRELVIRLYTNSLDDLDGLEVPQCAEVRLFTSLSDFVKQHERLPVLPARSGDALN